MRNSVLSVLGVSLLATVAVVEAAKPPGAGGGGAGGGGSGTDGYVGQNLGALPGDSNSDAWDVNASGRLVGRSYGSSMRAFYWDGTMHQLLQSYAAGAEPPADVAWDVEATAVSGGSAEIVAGNESREICTPVPGDPNSATCEHYWYPIIWDAGPLNSMPNARRLGGGAGSVLGINDAGTIIAGVGTTGAGTVWRNPPTWTRTDIALDAFQCTGCSYESGGAWDVNNDGIVVGFLSRTSDHEQFAYVYDTARGVGSLLAVPAGYVQVNAYAISNIVDGLVYVAGVVIPCGTMTCTGDRGIRWRVAVSDIGKTGYSPDYELLDQLAWAEGVSDQGFVAGTMNSTPDRRGNIIQTAMLWKQSVGYIPLKPPKGGSDSATRSMAVAANGTAYVVGVANAKGSWTAARWVVP